MCSILAFSGYHMTFLFLNCNTVLLECGLSAGGADGVIRRGALGLQFCSDRHLEDSFTLLALGSGTLLSDLWDLSNHTDLFMHSVAAVTTCMRMNDQ